MRCSATTGSGGASVRLGPSSQNWCYISTPASRARQKTTLRRPSSGEKPEPPFGASALLSVSAPWLRWSAGVTTSLTGRARKILPCAGTWKPILCRTLSSTSSDVRANCAAISYPLPATSAESPTSFSAWKRSAPCGSAASSLTTRHSATTPTCSPA